jgi:hypothetical protein
VEACRVRHYNPPLAAEEKERSADLCLRTVHTRHGTCCFAPKDLTISPTSLEKRVVSRFQVKEGDVVEVSFSPEDEEGSVVNSVNSWWEGVVVKIKGDFHVVEFPEEGCFVQEVVEKERLRYTRWTCTS